MNCCTPGLPVYSQLPEFTQTHVHRVGDTIQPSHPLLSPFPLAPSPSQETLETLNVLLKILGQTVALAHKILLLNLSKYF